MERCTRARWKAGCEDFCDLGAVVNIHCTAANARARFEARQRRSGKTEQEIHALLERLHGLGERVVRALDLGCDRIDVDTNNGYEPALDEIAIALNGFRSGRPSGS